MRKVLKDQHLEAALQKDGFVKVPFLSAHEVEALKSAFFDSLPERGGKIKPADENIDSDSLITYDFTFIDKNVEYKKKVFEIISTAFAPHVEKYLNNYKPIIANFIKKEEAGGEVPLHQNWAFVDEEKCTSVSIWCPLVDSTIENGTLQFVPGSHKRFSTNRGPMIRWEMEDIKEEIIANHLVPIEAKAGEAVILDDSVIHYSAINKTPGLRLTIQLILIPEEEPSIHFHLDHSKQDKKVEVFEVDQEFYLAFNPWKKPKDAIRKTSEYAHVESSISIEEFKSRLYQARVDEELKSQNPLAKVKNWIQHHI